MDKKLEKEIKKNFDKVCEKIVEMESEGGPKNFLRIIDPNDPKERYKILKIREKGKKSVEDLKKNYSKIKMGPFQKFGGSYVAIRQLVDFMSVLKKNEKDYQDEINIKICKDTELHPSDILSHYICLEVCKFYETLRYLKRINKSLPNLPSYFSILQKIRNKVIAHNDTMEEFSLAEDILKLLKELHEVADMDKIVNDVDKNYKLVEKILANP